MIQLEYEREPDGNSSNELAEQKRRVRSRSRQQKVKYDRLKDRCRRLLASLLETMDSNLLQAYEFPLSMGGSEIAGSLHLDLEYSDLRKQYKELREEYKRLKNLDREQKKLQRTQQIDAARDLSTPEKAGEQGIPLSIVQQLPQGENPTSDSFEQLEEVQSHELAIEQFNGLLQQYIEPLKEQTAAPPEDVMEEIVGEQTITQAAEDPMEEQLQEQLQEQLTVEQKEGESMEPIIEQMIQPVNETQSRSDQYAVELNTNWNSLSLGTEMYDSLYSTKVDVPIWPDQVVWNILYAAVPPGYKIPDIVFTNALSRFVAWDLLKSSLAMNQDLKFNKFVEMLQSRNETTPVEKTEEQI